jgi:hypothetical protein
VRGGCCTASILGLRAGSHTGAALSSLQLRKILWQQTWSLGVRVSLRVAGRRRARTPARVGGRTRSPSSPRPSAQNQARRTTGHGNPVRSIQVSRSRSATMRRCEDVVFFTGQGDAGGSGGPWRLGQYRSVLADDVRSRADGLARTHTCESFEFLVAKDFVVGNLEVGCSWNPGPCLFCHQLSVWSCRRIDVSGGGE